MSCVLKAIVSAGDRAALTGSLPGGLGGVDGESVELVEGRLQVRYGHGRRQVGQTLPQGRPLSGARNKHTGRTRA